MSILNSLKIKETISKSNPNSSSFVFHHLPPTSGITIGNFFRRILLNHVSGIAIVGVEISDKDGPIKTKVDASWKGIDKPIPWYLIDKLKGIIFAEREVKKEIFRLEMVVENNTKKERIITAGDFSKVKEVEIKNPEWELFTLSPGGELGLKLYCQKSWGYHERKREEEIEEMKKMIGNFFPNEADNIIVLDTNYSPVKLVNSQVDEVVVDLTKKEEKLTLTIDTNGLIKPKKAFQEALEIIFSSFNHISKQISKKEETKTSDEVSNEKKRVKGEEKEEINQES